MKHLGHILFAFALLLGLLIISHHQKGENARHEGEPPDLEHIEIAAEIHAFRIKESRTQPSSSLSALTSRIFGEKFRDPADLNHSSYQVLIKIQQDIFLELKPVIDFRSGQYHYYPSTYGDPPGIRS